jgi:hypothetical protein
MSSSITQDPRANVLPAEMTSSVNCRGFASLCRSQMLKLIGRSRIDRDAIRRQRASPEGIHWLSTLSRRTFVAESDFGLTQWGSQATQRSTISSLLIRLTIVPSLLFRHSNHPVPTGTG